MTGEQEKWSKLLDREEVYFIIDYWDGPGVNLRNNRRK